MTTPITFTRFPLLVNSSLLISKMLNKDLKPGGGVRSSFWDESCVPFIVAGRGPPVAAQRLEASRSYTEEVEGPVLCILSQTATS